MRLHPSRSCILIVLVHIARSGVPADRTGAQRESWNLQWSGWTDPRVAPKCPRCRAMQMERVRSCVEVSDKEP
jgi:hypothetical protein